MERLELLEPNQPGKRFERSEAVERLERLEPAAAWVSNMPDVPREEMAVGARHRLSLRAIVSMQKMSAKPLSHAIYAIFYC
jgi:hypothetical protein